MAKQLKLSINPTGKQTDAWNYVFDDHTTELGFGGGGGGGKSYFASGHYLTFMCNRYADTHWLLGRKELLNLKRTSLKTLFKVFAEQGLKKDVHYVYNQQESYIRFWNKSEIILMNLAYEPSDPLYLRLGGLELTGAVVEESNEIQVMGLNILKTRLGRWNNDKYNLKPMLIETFNPDKGHVYHSYWKPYKDGKLPPYRAFVQALPTDNPHNTEAYIDQLRRSDEITKERLLKGNFEYDNNPLALMSQDAIGDLFYNKPKVRMPKYLISDVARHGMDKAVVMPWHGLFVPYIKSIPKCDIDVLWNDEMKPIEEREEIPHSNILADEDGVGGGLIDFARIKGFINNSTPKKIKDPTTNEMIKPNYKNLRSQCYHRLSQLVNERAIGIGDVPEDVKELIIEELSVITRVDADKDTPFAVITKDEIKEKIGRSPDYSDTLMMRMFFELPKEPEPNLRVLDDKITRTESDEPVSSALQIALDDPFMNGE